jgi:hypothetical protein
MLRLPAAPNVQGLDALRTIPQGGYEVYEDVLYDTVTYPAAGVGAGGSLLFFTSQANTADATLTNLRQPGQLPAPQFFYARAAFLEPLIETSIGNTVLTAAGRSQDLDRLMFTARGFFSYTNSVTNRTRGPIPLSALGGIGGSVVSFGGNNAPAAGVGAVLQQVKNHPHGGWPLDMVIKWGESIAWTATFGTATAISADLPLRLVLFGWRYVKAG